MPSLSVSGQKWSIMLGNLRVKRPSRRPKVTSGIEPKIGGFRPGYVQKTEFCRFGDHRKCKIWDVTFVSIFGGPSVRSVPARSSPKAPAPH